MNKKQSKKFVYDELKDQFIVQSIKQDFKQRQQERKPYELSWELNMNFFVGNQYCYISGLEEISDTEKRYYWENREVYNHIAPIIEARLSKLNKISPSLSVKPNSNQEKDFYSSKLAKVILQNVVSKNNLKDIISLANFWSEITGTSFYKITWEDDEGEVIGDIDGKKIKSGDVKVSVCSPFEIYPDSNGAWELDDCNSIITARAYPVSYVNEKYSKNFVGSDIDICEIGGNTFLSGMSGRSNITKINHSKKHNQVLVIERYEKPSKANPEGKLTIICEDELLYDGELPYITHSDGRRGYPFIRQVSSRQIGSFWGISVIERCIPIQRAYNAIKNKKHEFIERLASGVLTVEDGSVDADNLENEGLAPGKILVYRNGATPPSFLSPGSIPDELKDEEDRLVEEMSILSSTSDMMLTSKSTSGISSGSALSLLIDQDNSRLSVPAENIKNAIVMVGKLALRLYKQFATTPRLYSICDDSGVVQVSYWKNNDITSDEVMLESVNEFDESATKIKNSVLSLYDKGVFSDENGVISSANKTKILNIFGLSNFESTEDLNEMHKSRAVRENNEINKFYSSLNQEASDLETKIVGKTDSLGVNESDASADFENDKFAPLEIDDHKIHITEHTRYLISDESNSLSESVKKAILNHIKKHKKLNSLND